MKKKTVKKHPAGLTNVIVQLSNGVDEKPFVDFSIPLENFAQARYDFEAAGHYVSIAGFERVIK